MKGGRLKIVNESRYPTDEVEALVRFALSDLDVKGKKLLAYVGDNRTRQFRGWGGRGDPNRRPHVWDIKRKFGAHYVAEVRIGRPGGFPITPFRRNGVLYDYMDWREALVGVMAHEATHVQHRHDGAYNERNGVRKRRRRSGTTSYRIGADRVEHKCAAVERAMLERFRAGRLASTDGKARAGSPTSTVPWARN